MKELVEVIAKALVDEPDSVVVTERQDGRTTVLEVRYGQGYWKTGPYCKGDPFCSEGSCCQGR